MEKYLEDLMQDLPEDMNDHATTPTASHLFDTHTDEIKLSDQDKNLFPTWVAKLLFLSKQVWPDIQGNILLLYKSARTRPG